MINYAEVNFSDDTQQEIVRGFDAVDFGDVWVIFRWPNGNQWAIQTLYVWSVEIGSVEE